MRLKYLIILCLFFFSNPLFSKHIIGGDLTYECLGNGDYIFELHIYRDCSSDGAAYDTPAFISLFECNPSRDCNFLNQLDATRLDIAPEVIRDVDPPEIPCLIVPPNICVEEAIYRFKLSDYGLSLAPRPTNSYFISYQRCCRNNTINNIVNPKDAGATYTIEITPEAQASCNSSPFFNKFPPTVICNNEPLVFDHSASDPDGDSLVYSFCSPLLGGGKFGTQENPGDDAACTGIRPNPSCPPPYDFVNFSVPTYTAGNPMGGEPRVKIDSKTGIITGKPNVKGQFVVGVCVEEFRDGISIGKLQRDFQFNVADCEPTVVAQIQNDTAITEFGPGGAIVAKTYLVSSCGNNTIEFINESFQERFVDAVRWEFDIEGQTVVRTDWDATITFPELGQFQGFLYLNPGTQCADTANIFVDIFPEIDADFGLTYDTCIIGPVLFTDSSTTNAERIVSWDWDFGDGSTSNQKNPRHTYDVAGTLPVTLTVTDDNNCQGTKELPVGYYPAPQFLVLSPNTFDGCTPADIFFGNLPAPINDEYDIVWDFGDEMTSGEVGPTHTYEEPGLYTVSVDVTSPFGCNISRTFPDYIRIRQSPEADFSVEPKEVSILNPTASFTDNSTNASSWFYNFNNQGRSLQPNPTFTFRDTGRQAIQLIVTHLTGCTDTTVQFIDVFPEVRWFMPNAFTPNDDGTNDIFMGKGNLVGAQNYNFSIWNRWGERVFETNNHDIGWNGRKDNVGELAPNDVYLYLVTYTGPRGKDFRLEGFATVVR